MKRRSLRDFVYRGMLFVLLLIGEEELQCSLLAYLEVNKLIDEFLETCRPLVV